MSVSWYPKTPLPELRDLVDVARAYLAGEVHFSEVCCAVELFHQAARLFSPEPAIKRMAEEWSTMATRVWPEMAQIDNTVAEEEFREWVRAELRMFEPLERANEQQTA